MSVLTYIAAAAMGLLLSTAELFSRYKDTPARAVVNPPAGGYIALNMCLPPLALYLVFRDRPFYFSDWVSVLIVTAGTIAILRTSFFKFRVDDRDVDVGPAAILQVMLRAIDRHVDRYQARLWWEANDEIVNTSEMVKGLEFHQVEPALRVLSAYLKSHISDGRKSDLDRMLAASQDERLPSQVRLHTVVAGLARIGGRDLIKKTIETVREEAKRSAVEKPPAPDSPTMESLPAGGDRTGIPDAQELETRITAAMRNVLAGPRLDNFTGYFCASVRNRAGMPMAMTDGRSQVHAQDPLAIHVWLDPAKPQDAPIANRVNISDGEEKAEVEFRIRVDSDTIECTPRAQDISVSRFAQSRPVQFVFSAPKEKGEHLTWVHLSQKNRLIQVLLVRLQVDR